MSDLHPDDQVTERFTVEIKRSVEIEKGGSYRFTLVGYQAKPHITEESARERTIVPVVCIEAVIDGTVRDISEDTLFILTNCGTLSITHEAIEWAERLDGE